MTNTAYLGLQAVGLGAGGGEVGTSIPSSTNLAIAYSKPVLTIME
jgi:hypothetical protein